MIDTELQYRIKLDRDYIDQLEMEKKKQAERITTLEDQLAELVRVSSFTALHLTEPADLRPCTDAQAAKSLQSVIDATSIRSCPKCAGTMRPGLALHSEMLVAQSRDGAFGIWEGSTCSYIPGHAQMIDCLKCEKCGCSILPPNG